MKKENYTFTYEELFIIQQLYNSKNYQAPIANIHTYPDLTNKGIIKVFSGQRGNTQCVLTAKGIDYCLSHITYFNEVIDERLE